MGQGPSGPLHKAVDSGSLSAVNVAVQQYPRDLDLPESQLGWTPLHVAAWKGFDSIARELLRRGANVNSLDKDQRTPLHLSALQGHLEVAQALLRANADKDLRDKNGYTALRFAKERHNDRVAALIESGLPQTSSTESERRNSDGGWGAPPARATSWGETAAAGAATAAAAAAIGTGQMSHYPAVPPVQPPQQQQQSSYPTVHNYAQQQQQHFGVPTSMQQAPPLHADDPPACAPAAASQQQHFGVPSTMQAAPPLRADAPHQSTPQHQQHFGVPTAVRLAPPLHADNSPPRSTQSAQAHYGLPSAMQQAPSLHADVPPPHPASQREQHFGVSTNMQRAPSLTAHDAPPPQASATEHAAFLSNIIRSDGPAGGTTASAPPASASKDTGNLAGQYTTRYVNTPLTHPAGRDPVPPANTMQAAGTSRGGNPPFWLSGIMSAAERARAQLERLGVATIATAMQDHLDRLTLEEQARKQASSAGSNSSLRAAATAAAVAEAAGLPLGGLVQYKGPPGQEYSYKDVYQATQGFSEKNKLGAGGFGTVYRGTLDGIPVAIKVMDKSANALQGRKEFEAEVSVLSRLRHPHIVPLIGSYSEQGILVYELMSKGGLDEQLWGVDSPLLWQDRTRVAAEIAAALLFLHSAPEPIFHLDVKPSNVLLDSNLTAKLGDVGLSRLVPSLASGGPTAGRGGATPSYMDPQFLRTGQFNAKSDIYSLGVMMLQMLTGQDIPAVVSLVATARAAPLDFGNVIDPAAGGWPVAEAMAFADVALKCTATERKDRPNLRETVLPTLMQLKQRTQLYLAPSSPTAAAAAIDDSPPQMFTCPITQDVMVDPVFAADGYTYERAAIEEWIKRSPTSPLTNIALAHTQLVPNHTLRSAIKEWQQQQRR